MYNNGTTQIMKNILATNKKLAKQRNRKEFLLRCRKYKVIPKSLKINLKGFEHCMSSNAIKKWTTKFSFHILNEAIRTIHCDINRNYKKSNELASKLQSTISAEHFSDFKINVKRLYDEAYRKHEIIINGKFEQLIQHVNRSLHIDCDKWIKNLTNIVLPPNVKSILALGPKFNLPVNNDQINTKLIIASIESQLQRIEEKSVRMELRNKVCNVISNFKKTRTKNSTLQQIIKANIVETKNFLKNNPDIIILNADKGNITVVMYKKDYDRKMLEILNDTKTYEKLDRDPTITYQNRCNKIISHWKKCKFIHNNEARLLTRYNSVCSKIYCQVKIHKTGFPLRPIVSCIDSATYNLSKMYANILKNVVGTSNRNIKNSNELVQKLQKVRFPSNYKIISLDVVSLFSNVPKELIISAVNKKWTKIQKYTNLPRTEFLAGLQLVIEDCCLQFNDNFYNQIFGCPMGSPSSPVFADLVMEILEDTVIPKLGFKLPFYWRYVDDILTAVPEDKVDIILEKFNSYNSHIKFTMEEEVDGQISFLEVLVIRNGRQIKTNWFHKQTWSGRYLNFESCLPITYKRNTISLLSERIMLLADPSFHEQNFELLKSVLYKNLYPKKLVMDVINKTKIKFSTNRRTTNDIVEKPIFVGVPYVQGLFEKLKGVCNNHLTLVGKPDNNLKRKIFSRLKDKTPFWQQSNLVYQVNLDNGRPYIGNTMQHLMNRKGQHESNIEKGNIHHSALCQYSIEEGHQPLWDSMKILHKETNKKKREILEMIEIRKSKNCVNKQKECAMLSSTYDNII